MVNRLSPVLIPAVSIALLSGCKGQSPTKGTESNTALPALVATAPRSEPSVSPQMEFGDGVLRFFVPPNAPVEKKLPFLLALHGLGGSGAQIAGEFHLTEFATNVQFVYAAPDGTMDRWGRRFWNAGASCCNFGGVDVDDVARLGRVIDYARRNLPVDPTRIFVVGYSNGGFMAHRLACERPGAIRALVSLAGAGPSDDTPCKPDAGVSVLEIHGDRDEVVPFSGGHLFGKAELPIVPPTMSGLKNWASKGRCEREPMLDGVLDLTEELPGPETQVFRFRGCEESAVALWKVRGGGHVLRLRANAWQSIWRFLIERS